MKFTFEWNEEKNKVNIEKHHIGAGYWRKGKKIYEKENKIQ